MKHTPSKQEKLRVDELTRLAFVWAEQDRAAMADACGKGTPERAEANNEYQQLKAYRTKRWGRTQMEAMLSKPMKLVNVKDMKASQQSDLRTTDRLP